MNDPLTKLYAGLTDKEKAVIAFTYRTQHNHLEVARIESAMAEQTFIGLPYGYRRMTSKLQGLALLYGIEHWRRVALCLTMQAGTMALIHDEDPTAYLPLKKSFEGAEEALKALEAAFDTVCLEHGLDSGQVRAMTGRQFYQVLPDTVPNAEDLKFLREAFEEIMN